MFTHIMVGSNDIDPSKKFYDAMFGVVGVTARDPDAKGRLTYAHNGWRFMVSNAIDGKPAPALNGGTIGFEITARHRPRHGTMRASQTAAPRSRTRRASARMALISPISVILMDTSSLA